jgi:3-hydroxyacyl-CoA dehydrogenase
VQAVIEETAVELGIERREIPDQEIVDRLVGALVDEGRKILDESIAQRASDIDIVYVYGYGFPAYRGGPMFFGENA